MLQTQLAALAVVATVLVACGCGGSSKSGASTTTTSAAVTASDTTTTTPTSPTTTVKLATGRPLTRAKWIAEGDTICKHVNTEVAAISVVSAAEYGRLLPQIALYYSTEAQELGKLVPPTSMASDGTQLANGLQLLSEYLNRSAREFQAGHNTAGAHLFVTALKIQKQPIAVAKRAGFKMCTDTN